MGKVYIVQTPHGGVVSIEGPEDATDDELIDFVEKQSPTPQQANPPGGPSTIYANPDDQRKLATDGVKETPDLARSALVDRLVRQGMNAAQIHAALTDAGMANTTVDQAEVSRSQAWLKTPAGRAYKGSIAAPAYNQEPLSVTEKALASPFGTMAGSYGNAATAGIPQLLAGQRGKDAIDAATAENPGSAFAGNFLGGATGSITAGTGLKALGLGAKLAAPAGNILYSTLHGADTAAPGQRGTGALVGATVGVLGEGFGQTVLGPAARWVGNSAPVRATENVTRGLFGRRSIPALPPKPTPEDKMIVRAVGDPAAARAQLNEASALNLPMSLADVSPGARSLAGSAVRRSPVAKQTAEAALNPRARGQIDRMTAGMDRDFGPGTNIPAQSEQLIQRGRDAARPLYEQAYATPGRTSPEIESLLQTPAGRQALGRARVIAANERRDPNAMGFDLNDQGEVVLTGVPSAETLDYVKRGLDDVLEGYRDPVTRRLHLDEAGRAIEGVRANFVRETDRLNPVYGQARAAYAGPAGEREALAMGGRALNQHPDQIGAYLPDLTEPRADQFRLGFREALGNRAESARFSTNPYETVAGSPISQERLRTVFPETAPRFIRQAEVEGRLAQTRNEVLGNSATAGRQIDDQEFGMNPAVKAGVDIAQGLMTGGPSVATGLNLMMRAFKDRQAMGFTAAAKQRAETIAPILLNNDAPAALQAFEALRRSQRLSDVIRAQAMSKGRRQGGLIGQGFAGAGVAEAGRN